MAEVRERDGGEDEARGHSPNICKRKERGLCNQWVCSGAQDGLASRVGQRGGGVRVPPARGTRCGVGG